MIDFLNIKSIEKRIKHYMNKLFFKTFIFLMKIIQIFLLLNKGTKIFINCHSIISLIIQGKGNQKILYNEFPTSPSEIGVNGVINNCDKTCEITK